jgi:hypothetical protein
MKLVATGYAQNYRNMLSVNPAIPSYPSQNSLPRARVAPESKLRFGPIPELGIAPQ